MSTTVLPLRDARSFALNTYSSSTTSFVCESINASLSLNVCCKAVSSGEWWLLVVQSKQVRVATRSVQDWQHIV